MSEYQYYEFQTVERPLTTKEQAEIKNCPAGFNSRQPEQFLYIAMVTFAVIQKKY